MLMNAMINATSAPTAAPAANPQKKLPVTVAAANPTMDERIMLPFKERLITPDRSVRVSPITAKTTGAAQVNIEPMLASTVLSMC
jgi:hypothetical protein